jgi:xylulokinase
MGTEYLLGVDIGTYSSKGVLVETNGQIVSSHIVEHSISMPKPGFFEHDAQEVWWHDFVKITRAVIQNSDVNPKQIIGIGTSAIGSCVLPVDQDGKPLRPGILYGIDTRASEEIVFLENALGRDKIFSQSGAHLSSQASGPKILWIRNHEPEVFKKTRWFLTSEAYLVYRLTGEASIDIYTAGGYAPLFDVYKRKWIESAAEIIAPLELLPQTYWSSEIVGYVTQEAAEETLLSEGTPVVAGTTDAAAEAISAGVAGFGDMMVMFGSSIFFIMKTDALLGTQKFWSSNFLEPGTFAFMGGMSTSGSLTTWFLDQFSHHEKEGNNSGRANAYSELAKLAGESPLGSRGLIALPYFEGERTPLHDPKARGAWFGLSLKHSKGDLYRSLLEGVAYGIRHNLEEMSAEGVAPGRILAVGGGTKNELWLQIVADVCNIELNIPIQQIGASFGDAFLAGVGVGAIKDYSAIGKWVQIEKIIKPNFGNHEKYDFYYFVFRDIYNRTKTLMHKMTDHHYFAARKSPTQ